MIELIVPGSVIGETNTLEFFGKFNADKYNYFAAHICYEEREDLLQSSSKSIYKMVKEDISRRIFSDKNENWTTVGDFMKQIELLLTEYEIIIT